MKQPGAYAKKYKKYYNQRTQPATTETTYGIVEKSENLIEENLTPQNSMIDITIKNITITLEKVAKPSRETETLYADPTKYNNLFTVNRFIQAKDEDKIITVPTYYNSANMEGKKIETVTNKQYNNYKVINIKGLPKDKTQPEENLPGFITFDSDKKTELQRPEYAGNTDKIWDIQENDNGETIINLTEQGETLVENLEEHYQGKKLTIAEILEYIENYHTVEKNKGTTLIIQYKRIKKEINTEIFVNTISVKDIMTMVTDEPIIIRKLERTELSNSEFNEIVKTHIAKLPSKDKEKWLKLNQIVIYKNNYWKPGKLTANFKTI